MLNTVFEPVGQGRREQLTADLGAQSGERNRQPTFLPALGSVGEAILLAHQPYGSPFLVQDRVDDGFALQFSVDCSQDPVPSMCASARSFVRMLR